MKIWYTDYQLYPKGMDLEGKKNLVRSGVLLRIQFEDGKLGYADVCPHPQFGDAPIEVQLRNLHQGHLTPLLKQSLACAKLDSEGRARGESLYSNVMIKSHFLVNDLLEFDLKRIPNLQGQGYTEFKIKLGSELLLETEMLNSFVGSLGNGIRLRLDFNSRLSASDFSKWLDSNLQWLLPRVEFFEDPVKYDPKVWDDISQRYQIPLAVDFGLESKSFELAGAEVVIVKPAVQSFDELLERLQGKDLRYVVTHYLDFPVGQMWALAEAQKYKGILGGKILCCGLQHQEFYESFQFQDLIGSSGPYVIPPAGTGLGFDEALEKQEWHVLK